MEGDSNRKKSSIASTLFKGALGILAVGAAGVAGYVLAKEENELNEDKIRAKIEERKAKYRNTPTGDDPNIEAFFCPILQELMVDPVMTPRGHAFERSAIEEAINRYHRCPLTQTPLEISDLRPCLALKQAIEEFREKHMTTTN